MKKLMLLLLFFTASTAFAQIYKDLPNETFVNDQDYANSEDQVLEVSKFLLSTPIQKDNSDRLNASKYLLKWMEGTPDYTFTIDQTITDLTGNDTDLLSVYFAAACETMIENKGKGKTNEEISNEIVTKLARYAADKKNNVSKLSKELKKAIKNLK